MKYEDYSNYKYGYDLVEGYSILPNTKKNKPSTFFKYYALTDYNVEALTNLYVYATHPNLFNDPFDCNEKLIAIDTWDDVKNLVQEKFKDVKDTFPKLEDACMYSRSAFWNILYRKVGLVSLAPRYDNYQMWSLYAQNNGFCLEFNVDNFPFSHFGPFPINYAETIPGPVHIGKDGGRIAMLIQTNVKNEWWKYEDEWRLYISNPPGLEMKYFGNDYDMKFFNTGDEHDRKFRYSIEALKGVILGPKFFEKMVPNTVSLKEIDVVCYPNTESKEYKVLDFLARITEKVPLPIKLAHLKDFSRFIFIPIHVIKYSDTKFRIINN